MRGRIISASVLGAVAIGAVALFLWLDNRDAPMVSAQEVVQTACGALAKIDSYDFIASVKAEQDGVAFPDTLTVKASISGNDYQVSFSAGSDNTSEGIKVGDKGYVRSTAGGNVWEVSEAPLQDIVSQLRHLGDSPICPDLSNVTWKADEELEGEKVTVYTSGDLSGVEKDALDEVDSSFAGEKHVSVHEYWVDASGLLVQHREDRFTLVQYEGSRSVLRYLTLARFLDVGEPNTITAPAIP